MFTTIGFAASTVAPIFSLIFIGVVLKRIRIISREFISTASGLVFKVALPAMVFAKMSQISSIPEGMADVILLFVAITLVLYILLWFFARKLPTPVHGSFVQGACRGNIAIVGLAVIENSFGLEAVQAGVVILMVMMPLYNLLATIVLSRSSVEPGKHPFKQLLVNMVKNPLIWAIAAGLPFGLIDIPVHKVIMETLDYLAQLAMPLALLSIGGSLTLAGMKKRRLLWIIVSAVKLIILPLIVYIGTLVFGIAGTAQTAVVLCSACPTAVASFAMADAMGADSGLAGEIISATTLLSIITITFWIVLLI